MRPFRREQPTPRSAGVQRHGEAGFTIGELLGVVAIVSIITLLAYPSMKTFSGQVEASGAATRLTHVLNQARSQAARRNRAVIVDFVLFQANGPGGRVDLFEARTNACSVANQDVVEGNDDRLEYLNSVPVGGTVVDGYQGTNERNIGFTGWRSGSEGAYAASRLRLCMSPLGQTFIVGPNLQTLTGFLELKVQRYKAQGGDLVAIGAGRRAVVPGFGAARMMVSQ